MSSLMMYFLVIADNLSCMLQFLIVGFTITFVISFIMFLVAGGDIPDKKAYLKYLGIVAILDLITAFSYVVMPNTRQLSAIIFIPKMYNAIVENKEIQKLPDNVVSLANEWIETLKPKVKETKNAN